MTQDNPLSGEDLFIQEFVVDRHTCKLYTSDKEGLLPCTFCEAKSKLTKLLLEQRIDPFDFVQACEPDCSKERHAYHQGQWDMATRISVHLNQLDKEKHE